MKRTGFLTPVLFICFCLLGCTQKRSSVGEIWLVSLDSVLNHYPPEYITEGCHFGRGIEKVNNLQLNLRFGIEAIFNINHFPLAVYFDTAENKKLFGRFIPEINTIRIYNASDTSLFGDNNKWRGRALLLSYELEHAVPKALKINVNYFQTEKFAQSGQYRLFCFLKNEKDIKGEGTYYLKVYNYYSKNE